MNTARLLVLVGMICLLPWMAGCALFGSEPVVPPQPQIVGTTAQDVALRKMLRQGHGHEPDVFVPLVKARAAVEAARAQPGIEAHAATTLAQARAKLNQAHQLWQQNSDPVKIEAAQLAHIASLAHEAERLAQIARYTAVREINLAQLGEVTTQLRAERATQDDAGAGADAQSLIGNKVVPGQLGRFSFKPGTAQLSTDSGAVVAALAALLQKHPQVGVAILGHTDNSMPPAQRLQQFKAANPQIEQHQLSEQQVVQAYHMALSNARARAVARALVDAGVAARRIGARGYGSRRPVASNDTAQGRAANNRVVAIIIPGPDDKNSPLNRRAGQQ